MPPARFLFVRGLFVRGLFVWGLCACFLLVGCESESPPPDYVARVGDAYLTQEELNTSLRDLAGLDTAEARKQIIEQWVTRTLLLQEALDRNLEESPDVQRRLREQERAVLVTALTNRIYDSEEVAPTDEEIRTYFARHQDQLRLREPYIRVRYLATKRRADAKRVHQRLAASVSDSLWGQFARQYAIDSLRALGLAQRYAPESRLFSRLPKLRTTLRDLQSGDLAPIVSSDSIHHVLQLMERIPAGTSPRLEWIRPEIRRRLMVRARKQMYAREVQRLRNEAKARNALEIR